MVKRGQPYRTSAQQKGESMRASGRSYRGGYTRAELKGDIETRIIESKKDLLKQKLEKMTKQELCDYCRFHHIKGYSGKNKQQRVDLILKNKK